jgi:hypothetical protein
VDFSGGWPKVTDGPFAETKELVAGYWMIQTSSREEAIDWAMKAPFDEGQIEIRQVFELSDFGSGEAIEHHARVREQLARG